MSKVVYQDDSHIVKELLEKHYGTPERVEIMVRAMPRVSSKRVSRVWRVDAVLGNRTPGECPEECRAADGLLTTDTKPHGEGCACAFMPQ